MRKITVALAGFAIAFSAILTVSTPVYADIKPCPAGSLQGEKVWYATTDATDDEKGRVTDPSSDNFTYRDEAKGLLTESDTAAAATVVLSSQAQCNMDGRQIAGNGLISTIDGLINVILGVLGIVAVIVIILGGVTYVTSAGDPGKVKKAKDTILYGIIGLVIALLAYAIVNFVLNGVLAN